MRKVTLSEMTSRMGPADVARPLSDALGTTDVALNYYELAPGESTAYGFHAHDDQEEVFYPLTGALAFETADGEVRVEAGEVVRFGRGEYQRSHNPTDDRVAVLAVGAPRESEATDVRRDCPDCGEATGQELSMAEDRSAVLATCSVCGTVTGRFD